MMHTDHHLERMSPPRRSGMKLLIRKTGALAWPWRVTCFDCYPVTHRHIVGGVGMTVVNDGGIGNGSFRAAMAAAGAHIRSHSNGYLS